MSTPPQQSTLGRRVSLWKVENNATGIEIVVPIPISIISSRLQLFRYNDDLHGAIVSFDKNSIRPTSSTTSLANSPADAFLHFTIKVDIILFAPKAGIYLSGECTEVNFNS